MASFTNQARLTYSGVTVSSNVVTGEIVEVITVTKTPIVATYTQNDVVTWTVVVSNSGAAPVTGLTLIDDLGEYPFGQGNVVPLDYTPDSVRLFSDGSLMPAPTVTSENPLTITGLTVPAGGNIMVLYETTTNAFAPPGTAGSVKNTVTAGAPALVEDVTASAVINSQESAELSITKSLVPNSVVSNGTITYTFEIENTGNTAAPDDVVVTDTFDPALTDISVSFNATAWEEGTEYNYDPITGIFTTIAGNIPVPAATFSQNAETGEYTVTPGTAVLTVTGSI